MLNTVELSDYRSDVLAGLRAAGLTASDAIALMRREMDTVKAAYDAVLAVPAAVGALLVYLEDKS